MNFTLVDLVKLLWYGCAKLGQIEGDIIVEDKKSYSADLNDNATNKRKIVESATYS